MITAVVTLVTIVYNGMMSNSLRLYFFKYIFLSFHVLLLFIHAGSVV